MATVRIKVGAALDPNTGAVFRPLIESAKKARAAIDGEFRQAGRSARALGPAVKDSTTKADRAIVELERQLKGLPSTLDKAGGAARQFGKEAEASFSIAKDRFAALAKEAATNSREVERSMERASAARAKALGRAGRWAATGAGQVGMMAARGALGAGRRIAGDVLSGAGVQLDIGAGVAQNVDLERRAVELSNAGYDPAGGKNGVRVDKTALVNQVREVSNYAAYDPTQAMEGLQAFVAKTGDLALGRDILKDMAMLSKASGSNLTDMVDAAGDVSNQLGKVDNKSELVSQVMRSIAGQGKLGAVEIKDMARQMAKVAGAASQFAGDRAQNIALMGAFAQEARQQGGASSATMAATSVAGMINTLKTPARVGAFAANGVQVFDKTTGAMRNPAEILIESLQKTGTNVTGFKKMWANVQGARAVEGFAGVYRSTYADTKGTEQERVAAATAAVRAEFERLTKVAMAQGEIQESFNRAMNTTESRVQLFNNQMAATAAQLQESLMPALQDLAPVVVEAAHAFAGAVELVLGKQGKSDAEKTLKDVNVMSHAMHALRPAEGNEGEQIYDPKTGTWHQRGREIDSRMPGAIGEQAAETARALDAAKAKERESRSVLGGSLGYDDSRLKLLSAAGDSNAENILNSAAQVKQLEQKLEETKLVQSALLEAIKSGTLQVKVMNPADMAPKRNVTADMSGRAPAESTVDSE